MRKFFFFLLLLPVILSAGHDTYQYIQNMDKEFQLSDIGALWDQYHKESHDKWKDSVKEFENTIHDLDPIERSFKEESVNLNTKPKADYEKGIQISDDGINETVVTELAPIIEKPEPTRLQIYVGFLLEQKALFVTGIIAAFFILLTYILGFIFGGRGSADNSGSLKKIKGKKGGYQYGRK